MRPEFESMFEQLQVTGQRALRDLLRRACDWATWGNVRYGSPVEQGLAVALVLRGDSFPCGTVEFKPEQLALDTAIADAKERIDVPTGGCFCCVYPQVAIGPYIADFLLVYANLETKKIGTIVVECDGHDFHERTKEQAAHDKARDRYLQKEGHKVFRYTGSEIWADAFKCADDVLWAAFNYACENAAA